MWSSKQFSVNEFFKVSLEQYLLVKCSFIKQAVDEAQKKEEKKQIIQDVIVDFIAFSKHVIGKNCKHPQIIIAEIIEKLLIVDFALMRKKEEDFPRDIVNRQFKLLLTQFERLDLHILQLFTRLQCLKLMYEFLTVAEKVPKGFNYREKFDSDLIKHIDQIKVYLKMNFSTSSEGDAPLLKVFRSLLQNCNCIEFYTFLHNFIIRNELSKEVKKFVRLEYENLRQKFSEKQNTSQNLRLVQSINDELSKTHAQNQNNLIASNNNSNPSQLIFMEGNSQGSENFCAMIEQGEENKKQGCPQRQRRQFNAIFIGNKGLNANPPQQQQNAQSNEVKSLALAAKKPFSKQNQYLSSMNGESSLNRLMEEENSNNLSSQFAEANKSYLQQNHTDFGYQNCGIYSEENTQFNLINFQQFSANNNNNNNTNNNINNLSNKNKNNNIINNIKIEETCDRNTIQNEDFKTAKQNQITPNNAFLSCSKHQPTQKESISMTNEQISGGENVKQQNGGEMISEIRQSKSFSFVSDTNSNQNIINSQCNNETEDNIAMGRRISSISNQSGAKSANSSTLIGTTLNMSASKIVTGNNQRQLSKPILSGRTMYQVSNKKVQRNSQSKISSNSKSSSIVRTNSKNNHLEPSQSSGTPTNNLLFEAASRVQQEQDQKRQAKLKLMSRESNKYQQSELFTSAATKVFKTPSTQENFLEGYQNINNHHQPANSEDENSMPLMYMWGHN